MSTSTKSVELVEIKPIEMKKINIRLVGDTPLIMHRWSEKARRQILDKEMGKTPSKKHEIKVPVEDFVRSMYWLTDMPTEFTEEAYLKAINDGAKFGFPVTAFKQAAISGAYRMGWVKDKMSLRGAFFIESDENGMVEVKSDTPIMREDMVRVGLGQPDIRYRGEFNHWYVDMTVLFNANGQFSLEQLLNIINCGGTYCGIGEWRPEKDGQNGMYHIETK